MKAKKGFTLVEILIVVVILGILAAIVIPQFSQASTEAKLNSCRSSLQSLRSQIELYKIQHNDQPPALADFAAQMTTYSDANGNTNATKDVANGFIYGPYIQQVPTNPWNNSKAVNDIAGGGNQEGWVYDQTTGAIYVGVANAPDAVVTELQATDDAL
ncbi:MAG TPA: prepilin-type N-terminal cleavage/methylation domain-containing protein [Anaerohalosphaeraceae bacterium]|nr:prepilin-type N-terminal cleavage/methylation domain-containing protein [Anaerohalosphaeraceae bacterium]HOL89418.1 prepilin-type N-terminal cleavage/methylation domain-containing protein [Anaerohalosphaeraceae bacterium]HPP55614.1 prepilin-type N-terminal cleavage/methylation domain-containing protein [Anaerohalosphaeraceae bacterium]